MLFLSLLGLQIAIATIEHTFMSEFEVDVPPAYAPRGDDTVFILVIGLTGSGKSTFINIASDSTLLTSESLDSCTRRVQEAPKFDFEGRRICLIDTPGFDDTDRSEVEILKSIKDFLEVQYNSGTLLHGMIYLQRITDVRMGGVSIRTLSMFRDLCGSNCLRNTVIVTNMWSKPPTLVEENRERQLLDNVKFFKLFIDGHATMVRHDNTVESAHQIIRQICNNCPSALDIQLETVEQKKALPATSAGITLGSGLLEPTQGLQAFVDSLQERLKKARLEGDQAKMSELQTDLGNTVPNLVRLYNELKNLQALTGEKIDIMQLWNNLGSKGQIIALFRRSRGADNNPEINAFWAALGDTIKFFKEVLHFFDENPLPLSIQDLLLRDTTVLPSPISEKFDKWLSDNRREIKAIRAKVDRLVNRLVNPKPERQRKRDFLIRLHSRVVKEMHNRIPLGR